MRTNLWKKVSVGPTLGRYGFNMTDDAYSCFIEFVELNDIQERECGAYFEAYYQMLKEM